MAKLDDPKPVDPQMEYLRASLNAFLDKPSTEDSVYTLRFSDGTVLQVLKKANNK